MKLADKFGCKHLRGSSELGPFWLSRNDAVEIKKLDNQQGLDRINPNKKLWYLVPKDYQPVSKLKDTKKGLTALIVGKGPSLDKLTLDDLLAVDLVIACNESVFTICDIAENSDVLVYNVQCDPLAGSCYDANSIPIILANCAHFYTAAKPMYLARNEDFGSQWHPVGCTAIHIAKLMGCANVVFVGFDGAFSGELGYADCIGKSPTAGRYSDPARFRKHKRPMLEVLDGLPYTILTPGETVHETSACDISEPSQDSHEEPNEHTHEEPPIEPQDTLD